MHHCVVEIRVEGGSCRRVDDGDIDALEALNELRHGHLDALFILSVRGLSLKRALEVVIRRQKRGDGAAYRVGVRLLALALAALAEVVIFCRHAEIAVVEVVVLRLPVGRRRLCLRRLFGLFLRSLLCLGLFGLSLFRLLLLTHFWMPPSVFWIFIV